MGTRKQFNPDAKFQFSDAKELAVNSFLSLVLFLRSVLQNSVLHFLLENKLHYQASRLKETSSTQVRYLKSDVGCSRFHFRCTCTGKLEEGNCVTHRENPCVRSYNERERPEFPQSYFGVIFVTDAFCDKDGCEGRIVVSEKYRDNKKGDRSREDLVMGLTQHITVIIIPEGSMWSQVRNSSTFFRI